MITAVRKFSVVYQDEPCKVLLILQDADAGVHYCVQNPQGEKLWLKDDQISLVSAEE